MQCTPNKSIERTLSNGEKSVLVWVDITNSARSRKFCARIVGKNRISLTKPTRASLKNALEFLDSLADWAIEKLAFATETYSLRQWLEREPRVFVDGKEWKVFLSTSRVEAFFVETPNRNEVVFLSASELGTEDELCKTFRDFATKKITSLLEETSKKVGIEFSTVSVRNQSGRWGSRSSSGGISLNWRILLLPPELQNYVICHELAHVRFMDHSVSFWIWLNSFCPRAKYWDRQLSKVSAQLFSIELR